MCSSDLNGRVKMVKVRWSENEKDVTWELEGKMRRTHPELFVGLEDSMPTLACMHGTLVTLIPYPN